MVDVFSRVYEMNVLLWLWIYGFGKVK